MIDLIVFVMLVNGYGVVSGEISLGFIFVTSLAAFLYILASFIFNRVKKAGETDEEREEKIETKVVCLIVSGLFLAYTVCYLFLGIDVKEVLGFNMFV